MEPKTYSYTVSQARLAKLGRRILRRAYRGIWGGYIALFAGYIIYLALWLMFDREITRALTGIGIPHSWAGIVPLAVLLVGLVVGPRTMRRAFRSEVAQRVDFDSQCHLTLQPNGVRLVRQEIEYLFKWDGTHLLFREPDGYVLMHGALGFLVPDNPFPDSAERDAFFRTVFEDMSEEARTRSQKEVRDAFA